MPPTAAKTATEEGSAGRYSRHQSEQTLLYRMVEAYYPAITVHLAVQGGERRPLPRMMVDPAYLGEFFISE